MTAKKTPVRTNRLPNEVEATYSEHEVKDLADMAMYCITSHPADEAAQAASNIAYMLYGNTDIKDTNTLTDGEARIVAAAIEAHGRITAAKITAAALLAARKDSN